MRRGIPISSWLIFSAFFVYAAAYNVIGTLITDVMATTGMDLSHVGLLMSSVQAGILAAILSSLLFMKHLRKTTIIRFGMFVIALGLLLIVLLPYEWMLYLSFAVFGFGGFCMDSGSNAYLAAGKMSRRSVPLLHFIYSTGALLSGYMIIPFKGEGWQKGYALFGILMALIAAATLLPSRRAESEETGSDTEEEKVPVRKILSDPLYILFSLALMMYMAAQQIGTNWYPYFIEVSFNASDSAVAAAVMSFWIGIAAMRLLSSFLLARNLSPILLSSAGMLLSCAGQVAAALSGNALSALIFIAVSGFAAGATIPCYIVEVSSWYRGNAFFVSTFYLLCGTAGRMLLQPVAAHLIEALGARQMLLSSSLLLFLGSVLAFAVMRMKQGGQSSCCRE